MTEQLNERVYVIISDVLNVNNEKFKPSDRLIEDLGADSLDVIEIIMKLEDEFDVILTDDVAENINTVGDISDSLSSLV